MNTRLASFLLLALLIFFPFAARAADSPMPTLHSKLLVLNFDPIIESEGGKRLHVVCGWRDSRELVRNHIADLKQVSHGQVRFEVADWRDVDEIPVKADGFRYTDASYLACWRAKSGWHQPDGIDYKAILTQFDIPKRVANGEIDEVWILSSPYTGTWESTMAGRGAYWCNSEPIPNVDCPKLFVVMGFNYERAEAEMIHDWGHRTESILNHVYGEWDNTHPKTPWDTFSRVGKDAPWPAPAGLGNTHFPPNALKDYQYDSIALVESTAEDWLTYPKRAGKVSLVNRDSWASERFPAAEMRRAGKTDYQRGYLKWWFAHLPHAPGRAEDGKLNNWWNYLVSPNLGLSP